MPKFNVKPSAAETTLTPSSFPTRLRTDNVHNLRSSAKVMRFPHEDESLIFMGISRKGSDIMAARQQIMQHRHPVSLNRRYYRRRPVATASLAIPRPATTTAYAAASVVVDAVVVRIADPLKHPEAPKPTTKMPQTQPHENHHWPQCSYHHLPNCQQVDQVSCASLSGGVGQQQQLSTRSNSNILQCKTRTKTTAATRTTAADETTIPQTTTTSTATLMITPVAVAADSSNNEEMHCLFYNTSVDMDTTQCTPRSMTITDAIPTAVQQQHHEQQSEICPPMNEEDDSINATNSTTPQESICCHECDRMSVVDLASTNSDTMITLGCLDQNECSVNGKYSQIFEEFLAGIRQSRL